MSKNRKKKSPSQPNTVSQSSRQRSICGWCGKPIAPGSESDNYYEVDEQWITSVGAVMGPVHKSHVREEDHPLYDQMPHIVFTGLPDELAYAQ
jgi:hypothetical protein